MKCCSTDNESGSTGSGNSTVVRYCPNCQPCNNVIKDRLKRAIKLAGIIGLIFSLTEVRAVLFRSCDIVITQHLAPSHSSHVKSCVQLLAVLGCQHILLLSAPNSGSSQILVTEQALTLQSSLIPTLPWWGGGNTGKPRDLYPI